MMYRNADYYKPGMAAVMGRLTKTRDDAIRKVNGNILFRVLTPDDIRIYSDLSLDSYDYAAEADRYVRDVSALYAMSFEARREIPDDALPIISPILGIGDYSAFLGSDILFAKDTSWSKPCLDELSEWRNLPPVGTAFWYRHFLLLCEKLLQASRGTGIPFSRGFFSPLDLAEALRGNLIYLDFYDHPDELHDFLDYCADVTIRFAEDIYAVARRFLAGEKYGMWYLDGSINMSEDIACMISPELYREFGAPHTQKVIDHFGTGFMHTHSRALYMVKEIGLLRNVANLWLASDPNQPVPVRNLPQLVRDAQSVCLAIDCPSFEDFESTLDIALEGNVSYCLPVRSAEEGCRMSAKAKELLLRKGIHYGEE